jgi:hypothetical protein
MGRNRLYLTVSDLCSPGQQHLDGDIRSGFPFHGIDARAVVEWKTSTLEVGEGSGWSSVSVRIDWTNNSTTIKIPLSRQAWIQIKWRRRRSCPSIAESSSYFGCWRDGGWIVGTGTDCSFQCQNRGHPAAGEREREDSAQRGRLLTQENIVIWTNKKVWKKWVLRVR